MLLFAIILVGAICGSLRESFSLRYEQDHVEDARWSRNELLFSSYFFGIRLGILT